MFFFFFWNQGKLLRLRYLLSLSQRGPTNIFSGATILTNIDSVSYFYTKFSFVLFS